jgi:YfiH family protein
MTQGVTHLSLTDNLTSSLPPFVSLPFYLQGTPLTEEKAPHAFLTLLPSGSMRFRWNENNENRNYFFKQVLPSGHKIIPLELIHSKTVYTVKRESPWSKIQGDGLITQDSSVVPVITAADCMPIYLYNPKTFCFGVLHSGWKGTGIISKALELSHKSFGTKNEDFLVILGPHIQSCCYTVDTDRAQYFSKTFTPSCITTDINGINHLSLAEANISILEKEGVPGGNIVCFTDCTSCSTLEGKPYLGSFRRETAGLDSSLSAEEKSRKFTPMAAFMYMN